MFSAKKGKAAQPTATPSGQHDSDHATDPVDAIVHAFERTEWYRDSYRKSWYTNWAVTGLLGLSILLNFTQFTSRERPQNYAVTQDLRIIPLTPLSEELLNPASVTQWAARVVSQCYSLDFRNYREQLASREPDFTKEGYLGFLESLKRANLIETIREQDYVVSAVVTATPTITGTGKFKGAFAWRISVPLLVTFQTGANTNTMNLVVNLVAVRVPETRNGVGIAINNFVAQRAGAGS